MEAVNRGFLSVAGAVPAAGSEETHRISLLAQARQAVSRHRLAQAADCLEEAYSLARQNWPASRKLAESCVRLADLRAAVDRRDDALQLYGEAVVVLGQLPDGVGGLLAHAVSNMGRMYILTGDQQRGQELCVAGEALQRKLQLPNSASIELNLGMAMAQTGDDAAATSAFRAAVAALESLPPADPQGIAVRDNFALYCLSTSRVGEAETLLRQSLILRQEAFGPLHPLYAAGLVNLARALCLFAEKHEEAESLLWQAKETYERGNGPAASVMLSALYFLACIAQRDKRREEAGRHCNAMVESVAPDARHATAAEAASLHVTARLWAAEGSTPNETENRLRRALALAEALKGGYRRIGVDIAAGVLSDLSELTRGERRLPEAERLAKRAAEMQGRLLWSVSRHVFMPPD